MMVSKAAERPKKVRAEDALIDNEDCMSFFMCNRVVSV